MTAMPFKQQCPGCATTVSIKDPKFIGKKIECPKCKAKFLIEDPSKVEEEAVEVVEVPVAAAKPAAAAAKPAAAPAKAPPPPKPAAPAKPKAFSSFKQPCPSCDAPVQVKEASQIGKKIECPQCKYRFIAAAPAEAPAAVQEESDVETVEEEVPKEAVTAKKPAGASSKKKALLKDDDDDFEGRPRAKKSSSGNLVLVLGISLSVLAMALLGVGGYFIFFAGSGDTTNPTRNVARNTNLTTTTTEPVEITPKGVVLVEVTNLLPNDTQAVYYFAVKDLVGSIVGSASFGTPGAFNKAQLEQRLGMKLAEIDRIVVADRGQKGALAVVRTTAKIDLSKLRAGLNLQSPKDGSLIKKQEYFVTEPSQWLANLAGQLTGDPKAAATPLSLALRVVDDQTFVVGDLDSIKEFLEAEGKPKVLSKSGDPKAAKGPASSRYLTIKPILKTLLDRVEAKPPVLVSVAADLEADPQQFAKFAKEFPDAAGFLGGMQAVAAALNFKEGVSIPLAVEMKDQAFGKEIVALLKKSGVAIAQLGIPVEVDGQNYLPPVVAGKGPMPPSRLLQKVVVKTLPLDNIVGINIDFLLAHLEGKSYLLESIRPPMTYARGLVEMARSRAEAARQNPPIFDLAGALQAYVKKNGSFPRGTVKPAGSRNYSPGQRLGWMGDLLPHLDHADLAGALKADQTWRPESMMVDKERQLLDANARHGAALVTAFLDPTYPPSTWWVRMPSVPDRMYGATHFVGIAGVGLDAAEYLPNDPSVAAKLGVFGYDRATSLADIKDGPASTIALIQVPPAYQRPWIAGGSATVAGVPEAKSIQPFVCKVHENRKGTFAIMADGSVRFIPETISDAAFKALCTINGNDKVDLDKETVLIQAPTRPELKTQPLSLNP